MQLTRPRAWTTSSLTLAVAVAVKAKTGVLGNFCFKIPRAWTFYNTQLTPYTLQERKRMGGRGGFFNPRSEFQKIEMAFTW